MQPPSLRRQVVGLLEATEPRGSETRRSGLWGHRGAAEEVGDEAPALQQYSTIRRQSASGAQQRGQRRGARLAAVQRRRSRTTAPARVAK